MAINYRRYFAFLLFAVGALFVASLSDVLDPFVTYWALVGFLHAVALVMAIRGPVALGRGFVFVFSATVLSFGATYGGLAFANLLRLDRLSDAWFFVGYTSGSAVGAIAYSSLVRAFWLPHLVFRDLLRTCFLCVAATLLSFATWNFVTGLGGGPNLVSAHLPTILWWAAFSFSLFVADRSLWLTRAGAVVPTTHANSYLRHAAQRWSLARQNL